MAAAPTLREILEREFPVLDLVYPWGTELATVEAAIAARQAAAGLPAMTRPFGGHRTGFAVPVDSVFGIPAVRQQVWAPAPQCPVIWVSFDLAPGHGLEGVAGLAAIRPIFDEALDEEPERRFVASGKPNPYGVAAQWSSGSTQVHLSTVYRPQDFLDGRTRVWRAGSLRIERDEQALLAPYLEAKLRRHPWDGPPGDVEVIPAPGLQTGTRGRGIERALATVADDYVTPQWVADRLGPEQVALWSHRQAGAWGFGDARLSRVLPTDEPGEFSLIRVRAARGPGRASLAPVVTAPGSHGLDRAAEALTRRRARVRVVEADDD